MTVRITKPEFNLREKLGELNKPTGLKGNELMRSDTSQDARDLISAGRKNKVINGDMRIAQRGTSAVTTSGSFTVDRWKNISNANDFSAQQSSVVPSGQGFYKSIHITPTSTKSPGSGTYFFTSHYIEGFNIGQLDWGTSGARTVTLSFWVRSSKTGIYTVGLKNAGATRSRQQEYTISSADTWEKKTITITGETSGSWPIDNTRGLALDFCLAGNASATSTLGSWISANSNMSTNQVNFFDSTSANWYITGVQLELGTQATDFEHRSHGEELALCQRYCQIIKTNDGSPNYNGHINASAGSYILVPLVVPMRTAPTGITVTNVGSWGHVVYGVLNRTCNSITFGQASSKTITLDVNDASGGFTLGQGSMLYDSGADGVIEFTGAEL